MLKRLFCAAIACLAAPLALRAAEPSRPVVIYDGVATPVTASSEASKDLWVTTADLRRATKFVVKPQGICRDQLCIPVPKDKKANVLAKRGSVTWVNLSEFARMLRQAVAHDDKNGVWFFGSPPDQASGYIATLDAPDFTLPDVNGKMHSLADFRGKKVMLITWASW